MSVTTSIGNEVFGYFRAKGDNTWLKAVCREGLELNGSAELIEAQTQCGVLRRAGEITYDLPLTIITKLNPDADEASVKDFEAWFKAKQVVEFKLTDDLASPTIEDEEGEGSITEFSKAFNINEFSTATITISVSGTPTSSI